MHKISTRAFAFWLPLIVGITGLFGFSYVAVQQNYRQSANDPQIQMAELAAIRISDGAMTPEDAVSTVPTGIIEQGTSPWMVVYDESGTLLAYSAVRDDNNVQMVRLPAGLFDTSTWVAHKTWHAPTGLETRVTWQPQSDIREAVVLVHYTARDSTGWVAVGRSLRDTEERVTNLTKLAAVAWGVTAFASYITLFVVLSLGWL
jgi:hypothetical protein